MTDKYDVQSTSAKSARVEDIWLNPPEEQDSALTRRILRAEIVDNIHSAEARVKATIHHQRRHSKKEPWQDTDAFNLAQLKAGQEVRLHLGAGETHHLYKELARLHELASHGVPQGERRFVLVDEEEAVIISGPARNIVRELVEDGDEEIWAALGELQPNLFRAVALTKLQEVREEAIREFEEHLTKDDWIEPSWQDFFERNTWIFGYGLSYRFLSTLESQPSYGGTSVSGSGGQRGDFLTATAAERRFTVLVEIKTPSAALITDRRYRNKVHLLGAELVGGVEQLQSNCRTWEFRGSTEEENREEMEERDTFTIQPKGILVIGNTLQLDRSAKRTTFELFRRNIMNPEIITFDELLERARHLVLNEQKELHGREPPPTTTIK